MEEVLTNHLPNSYFANQAIHPQQLNTVDGLNHNSLPKHQVKSMKSRINQMMIKVTLSKNFNSKQFKIISSIPPQQWIKSQKQLLQRICADSKSYEQFFSIFYKNHLTIANWYLLGIRQKSLIQPYLFQQLFQQLFQHKKSDFAVHESFNNERLKQSISLTKKKSLQKVQNPTPYNSNQRNSIISSNSMYLNESLNNGDSENASFMKPTFVPYGLRKVASKQIKQSQQFHPLIEKKQQLKGLCLNNLVQLDEVEHKSSLISRKVYKQKKKQNIDSHDLYMKTFDACNGRKYIFYDYEKHMKGLKERTKQNQFLRNGSIDSSVQYSKNKPQSQLKRMNKFIQFQEFKLTQQKQKQKCSLLSINTVLNQKQLNNYQGLKKVVSQNKSSKVVFVNHQGKPITYYIREDQKVKRILQKKIIGNITDVDESPKSMLKMMNSGTFK